VGYCIEKLPDHLRIHFSDLFHGKLCLIFQKRTTGKIDCRKGECFIHWKEKESKPPDPFFIADCFCDRPSKNNPGILDGVMRIYVQIAFYLHFQVKKAVPCKPFQHMVKKSDSGPDLCLSGPV